MTDTVEQTESRPLVMGLTGRKRDRGKGKAEGEVKSLVAAATLLNASTPRLAVISEDWQKEAWSYNETCGEMQFAVSWLSNGLSRVRVVPAKKQPDGQEPVPLEEDDPNYAVCWQLRDQLAGGATGQSQMMADFGVHLSVSGVCYLVGEQLEDPFAQLYDETSDLSSVSWVVYSSDELRRTTASNPGPGEPLFQVQEGPDRWRDLSSDTLVVKMFRPDRRYHWKATSPTKACLPVLRELAILTQYVDTVTTSRLAGAGILFVPSEVQFPDLPDQDENTDSFTLSLIQAMTTPITDPTSAARVVPLVLRVPAEYIEKFKTLDFSTQFDKEAINLRKEAIDRYSAGMDVPKEIITGTGDVNHWGAWQITDSGIRMHIEPMSEIVCHALTLGYYQPALQAAGVTDPSYCLWYDASELRVVANEDQNAKDLFDRQLISASTYRDACGFDDSTQPDQDELRTTLLLKVLDRMPPLAGMILTAIGIEDSGLPNEPIVIPRETISETSSKIPVEEGSPPGVDPNKPQAIPSTPAAGPPPDAGKPTSNGASIYDDALFAALDGIVFRAMERTGNKIRSQLRAEEKASINCPSWAIHTVISDVSAVGSLDKFLDGAWERTDEIAERYGMDGAALRRNMHGYCRMLLTSGKVHTYTAMVDYFGGQ